MSHHFLQYFGIKNDSVGPYGYGWHNGSSQNESFEAPPLELCVIYYPVGIIRPEVKYYNYSGKLTSGKLMLLLLSSVMELP